MALNLRTAGDYIILPHNVVPGKPKSGWTPKVGELVKRETAQDNEFDVCADTEVPEGIVVSINGTNPPGIALFVDGVSIILPTTGVVALNNQIQASAGGLVDVGTANFQRSQVRAVVSGGIGSVIDLEPYGANTATVAFFAGKP